MSDFLEIRALYEAYIARVEELERKRRPGEGIFGLRGGPADNPCHDEFASALQEAVAAYAAEGHTSEEVSSLLTYMFDTPKQHREPRSAYWMLLAVQSLALELIPALTPADADVLRRSFARDYPRWERLPVHDKLLKALKARAGES